LTLLSGPATLLSADQFLYLNQIWRIHVVSLQGGSFIGGQFRDSFGNKIGGPQLLGTGSDTRLYTGGEIVNNYFLALYDIDQNCQCTQTVVLITQICNGFVP
jgi:hypothetical protein